MIISLPGKISLPAAISLFLLSLVSGATGAELTPDQRERVKLMSSKWGLAYKTGEELQKSGKFAEAEDIYKKILEERGALGLDLLTEYDHLAAVYSAWGKPDLARKSYTDMIAARERLGSADDPQMTYPLEQYAKFLDKVKDTSEAARIRARIASIQKNAASVPQFGKIKGAPGSAERIAESEKMRLEGEKWVKRDLQDKALVYFNRAVELNPENVEALVSRGQCYSWFEKNDKARADFDKAIKLKADCAKAFVGRAYLNQSSRQNQKAIADFEAAERLNPNDTDSMGARAKLLDTMGSHKLAIDGYTKIIKTDPALYWPYIQRAVAYDATGDHKKAAADYTTLVERAPEDPDYYEYRGESYIKDGNFKAALNDCNKLIELSPKYVTGYKMRARVYEKLDGKKSDRVLTDLATVKKLGY